MIIMARLTLAAYAAQTDARLAGLEDAMKADRKAAKKAAKQTDAKLDALTAAVLKLTDAPTPAKAAKAAPKPVTAKVKAKLDAEKAAKEQKSAEFVQWMRDTAEARAARKARNAEVAAWLDSKGLPKTGVVWEMAVAGERGVAKLRKAGIAAEQARKAAKANA